MKIIILFIFLFTINNVLYALSTDKTQPIQLSADNASIRDKKGISIYSGNVVLTQGSLLLKADELSMHHNKQHKLTKVIASGSPVYLKQRPDNEQEDIKANAQVMHYDVSKNIVIMEKSAVFWQLKNSFRGEKIVYDMNNATVTADAKKNQDGTIDHKKRVHVTISPN